MSSELKFLCLEWCSKLPIYGFSLKSPIFLLQGCECSVTLNCHYIKFECHYFMYVEVKSVHSKWKPCDVKLRIGFKNEKDFSLGETTFTVSENALQKIWSIENNFLESKLPPSDDMEDTWIKFRFCFEDVEEHIPKFRKKIEHKCLQTASYLTTDVVEESCIEDMSKLMDNGINHDAEIKCGDRSIKVHKNILCARSDVLKAMLQGDLLEGRTGVVEIKDIDERYIQDFVRYLYTGAMPDLSFEKAKVLYEAGDKYAVRSLMIRCSEYLQDNLSPENAFECLALADAHSDETLIDSIVVFSLEKKMYLQDELWNPFCERYPKLVVKAYRLLHKNDTGRRDE